MGSTSGADSRGSDGDEGADAGLSGVPIVVPDDARELDRDLEALRREERWRRRNATFGRWGRLNGPGPSGVPGRLHQVSALLVATLVGLGLVLTVVVMLTPREVARHEPHPQPLALAAPTVAAGSAGGLLPDATVAVALATAAVAQPQRVNVRDLRPALVGIVATRCACDSAVRAVAEIAQSSGLQLQLVGAPEDAAELGRLAHGYANVHAYLDDTGALLRAYRPVGLSVVPIHADGVSDTTVRNLSTATIDDLRPLKTVISTLTEPGGSP